MSAVHASGVGGARPNDKRRHDQTIVRLRAELRAERAARNEAERNARRFHGMLLAERIGRLPARRKHSAVTAEWIHLATTSNGIRRSTYPGSAADASQEQNR